MWMDTSGWPNRTKECKVNHFVTLLKVDTQDNWITITRKRKMAKTSNHDEKKRSSPTNRNKTSSFQQNSTPTKSGRREFFQRNNLSSKLVKSSATNTPPGNHTSPTASCSKLFPSRRRDKKSSNRNAQNTTPVLKVDTQDNCITVTRKGKVAKTSNYHEKKSSPTNRNKPAHFSKIPAYKKC